MSLTWRLLAPVYDRFVAPLEPSRRRVISAANVEPDDRVLLIGCGTGLTLRSLPPGVSVVAVDRSAAMVERTRRRAADCDLTIDAQSGDATDLDLPANAVDIACLHLVLSVAGRPSVIMDEVARVLGPDGRLSLLVDESATEPTRRLTASGFVVVERPEMPPGATALIARPTTGVG